MKVKENKGIKTKVNKYKMILKLLLFLVHLMRY